jgi:hypothetical protein
MGLIKSNENFHQMPTAVLKEETRAEIDAE